MIKITLIKSKDQLDQYKWEAQINDNKALIKYGTVGGSITANTYNYTTGKNIGKANEQTPIEVCEKAIALKALKKYEQGYSFITGEEWVRSKTGSKLKEVNQHVPLPMLAKRYEKNLNHVNRYPYVYTQPKYDGNRCIVDIKNNIAYSKHRKQFNVLNHILQESDIAFDLLLHKGVQWVEGELYANDLDFYEIQSALSNEDKVKQLKLFVFDIIIDKPLEFRNKLLSLINETQHIKVTETKKILIRKLTTQLNNYLYDGYEGMIIRIPGSIYENKKSNGLLKYKKFIDEECLILDININYDNKCIKSIRVKDKNGIEFNTIPAFNNIITTDMYHNKNKYINRVATVSYIKRDLVTQKPIHSKLIKFRNSNDMDNKL